MHRTAILAFALLATTACSPGAPGVDASPTGAVRLAAVGSSHDVASVRFDIVEATGDCMNGPVVVSKEMPLEDETLAPNLGEGDGHRFSDALFILPPADYIACGTPLRSNGLGSAFCAPASLAVTVFAQQTEEHVLVSQCDDGSNGGLDVVLALNDPPSIDDLDVAPSKFIQLCESATMTVTASDPDGDPLSYSWSVTAEPPGASPVLAPAAETATFSTDLVGDYEVTVIASDPHGAVDSATFPIHVSSGPCNPAGSAAWLISGGALSADEMSAVAVAPDGHIFATALFWGTVDFGAGALSADAQDTVLLKIAPDGAIVWQKLITESQGEEARALAVDGNGDVLIAGHFGWRIDLGCGTHVSGGVQDGFFGKLDGATGACLWSHHVGGSGNDFATAIAADTHGNVVVGGHFGTSTITIPGGSTYASNGGFDAFYASFDEDGAHRWDHRVGDTGNERLWGLDVDDDGEIVIVGSITSTQVTFDPGVVSPSHNTEDFYVALLSGGTGNLTHLLMPSASGNDRATTVAFDPIGDIVFGFELEGTVDLGAGPMTTTSQRDVVVTRLHGDDLSHDWSQQLVGGAADAAAVAVDSAGDIRLSGSFNNAVTIGSTTLTTIDDEDVFVASLNGINGDPQWLVQGGSVGGDDEALPCLATDATGATYAGGRFGKSFATAFTIGGSSPVNNSGNFDAFLVKLLP